MTDFITLLRKSYYVLTLFQTNRLYFVFFCMLLLGIFELAGIASVVPFVQIIENPDIINENKWIKAIYDGLDFHSVQNFTIFFGVCVIAMLVLNNLTAATVTWLVASFVNRQGHLLSCYLIREYVGRPYLYFLGIDSSELAKNLLNEVYRVAISIQFALMQAMSRLIISIMIVALLIIIDFQTAIAVSTILVSAYLVMYKLLRSRIVRAGKVTADTLSERFRIVDETFDAIKEIKLRNLDVSAANRFVKPSSLFAKSSTEAIIYSVLPKYLLEIVAFGGVIILMLTIYVSKPASTSVISIMSLYIFAGYRLIPSLQQIYQSWTKARYHYPALEALYDELIVYKNELQVSQYNIEPSTFKEDITFNNKIDLENIQFQYPDSDKKIIDDLSVTIEKNSCIAFVGESGAGKSTLVDMLLGIFNSQGGKISIDGTELNQQNIESWRSKIGYVPQTIVLLNSSISRNIAFEFSEKSIDMKRVELAAKVAGIDDFIKDLDDSFDTITGENGVKLSGGQRQRIGIARALYNNPEILIFDEATSALDGITEDIVMSSIQKLKDQKTIILIAHRLTTIQDCDVIHVMKRGRIIGSGNYEELLERNDTFRKMAKAGERDRKIAEK